jgi:hypothetical protein
MEGGSILRSIVFEGLGFSYGGFLFTACLRFTLPSMYDLQILLSHDLSTEPTISNALSVALSFFRTGLCRATRRLETIPATHFKNDAANHAVVRDRPHSALGL